MQGLGFRVEGFGLGAWGRGHGLKRAFRASGSRVPRATPTSRSLQTCAQRAQYSLNKEYTFNYKGILNMI